MILPTRVMTAIGFNNQGLFFEAHEELELVWRAEHENIREFYQALLWVSVINYHAERENLRGVRKLVKRTLAKLTLFTDANIPVDISFLINSLRQLEKLLSEHQTENLIPNVKIPVVRIPLK